MGTPWGPLGDPLGTTWGPLGNSLGPPGTPWESFGDLWESLGYPLGIFVDVLGFVGEPSATFWDHFGVLLDTLGTSSRLFAVNLELQRTLIGPQRSPGRVFGGILGAFWRLRKRSRSDLLQYAKTFKFTVRYCKNRGLGRPKPLKISHEFLKNREKTCENHKFNNIITKIGTGAAKMVPGSSKMSSGGG